MRGDDEELKARQAVAQPTDMVRGMVFQAVLQLVTEHAGADVARRLGERVAPGGVDDYAAYPVGDFLTMLWGAADVLTPHLESRQVAIRECGASTVHGFLRHSLGKVLLRIVGMGDPRLLYRFAPMAYHTVVSYGERRYRETGPRAAVLEFRGDMMPPAFHVGGLGAALAHMGYEGTVEPHPLGVDGCDYHITWGARGSLKKRK